MNEVNPEILSRIRQGETNLFKEIVDIYKDRAFSLTIKILKNREESEDALQESFLRLFRAISSDSYEAKAKFSTYFYTIVYNTAVDYYRKYNSGSFNVTSIEIHEANYNDGDELTRDFEPNVDRSLYDTESMSTERNIETAEVTSIIRGYINTIPQQYSVILNMFFINELSHEEISTILKIPLGTVKNRIFRAKEKLKEILFREFNKEELIEYIKV
ncbi:MAG: sigma-70 family RNA polymerase sigma factor [Ignavibacteria bacterium]|nr:sigma-70 family RNA polymerase sigma factor [Ignavibacteria bacterium]